MNRTEVIIEKGIMGLDDKELVSYVEDNFIQAKDARIEYENIWEQNQKVYKGVPEKAGKGKSNLFIPITQSIVETIVARLSAPFYNLTDTPISTIPLSGEDKDLVDKVDILITKDLHDMDFPKFNEINARQFVIHGTSVAKVFWRPEEERPDAEVLDIYDFFVDPEASDITDARFCIHRKFISMKELKERERQGVYKNIDDLHGSSFQYENTNPERFNDESSLEDAIERDVEILEYWENDFVCVVADRRVLLNKRENPYTKTDGTKFKPFIKLNYTTRLFKFYGIGIPELITPLQLELNTKRNQRLNNVNIILNKMWLLQRGMVDDLKQLESKPGGIIIANDINGIKPLDTPDVTSSSYREEDIIKADIDIATGVNEYIRGQRPEQRQSATEVQIKTEQSLNKLDYTYRIFVERGLKEMCKMFLYMRQSFMVSPKLIKKFTDNQEQWDYLYPEEIENDFDIIINPDPLGINETQQIQKFQMAMQVASQVGYNPQIIADYTLKKLGVDDVMLNEMKMQAQREIEMMQAMQQQDAMEQEQINAMMQEQGLIPPQQQERIFETGA